MNAYELAKGLMSASTLFQCREEAANMLRQQADRIAELEKENSELKYEKSSNAFGCPHGVDDGACKECYQEHTNAEPVAWLWINNGITYNALLRDPMCNDHSKEHWAKKGWSSKPLYTTPQTKPRLSDEEILEIRDLVAINYGSVPALEFAWAIEERHGIK